MPSMYTIRPAAGLHLQEALGTSLCDDTSTCVSWCALADLVRTNGLPVPTRSPADLEARGIVLSRIIPGLKTLSGKTWHCCTGEAGVGCVCLPIGTYAIARVFGGPHVLHASSLNRNEGVMHHDCPAFAACIGSLSAGTSVSNLSAECKDSCGHLNDC